ncbi:MetQ/NlpA family ABC transporter substrate-binding protein [Radiobacillus sp. PE A8.2]|uniref:MetQ/NlpA family ABC transporter substrate-binding protein n=1 Tax=Radiobacillus sp. PE A8.2 TaxID=3380349 RepID=UPI00388D1EB1
MKKTLFTIVTIIVLALLTACASSSGKETETVKIGVTAADGPVWELVKKKAEEEGIEIELVEFSDYIQPNNALVNEEIDMNSFQHLAFLGPFMAEYDLDNIVAIGSTTINPTGLYSDKYTDIEEIPDGSLIGVSDDPANLGRGLKLLEAAGLIKIDESAGIYGTPEDIVENPKGLEFSTMVSQQTARVLPDVAASLINSGIAGQAGLKVDDAIIYDDPYSEEARPYINVFAVRTEDKDNETYQAIAKLYQDADVQEAVKLDTSGASTVVDIPVEQLQETLDKLIADVKAANAE